MAVEFVEAKTAETCSVPLSHALIPRPALTVACVVFVGGVTSTVCAEEQVVVFVWTSLKPTLKYATAAGASVTWEGETFSKFRPPPRTTVVGSGLPVVARRSIPGYPDVEHDEDEVFATEKVISWVPAAPPCPLTTMRRPETWQVVVPAVVVVVVVEDVAVDVVVVLRCVVDVESELGGVEEHALSANAATAAESPPAAPLKPGPTATSLVSRLAGGAPVACVAHVRTGPHHRTRRSRHLCRVDASHEIPLEGR